MTEKDSTTGSADGTAIPGGSVRLYEDTRIIPTYELGEDSLNPIFDKMLDPYPYTMQNSKTGERRDVVYETVMLENEYVKLTVIPSLGGRLYSAVDKRNGKAFLYANKVVRPRMIGTRGCWFPNGRIRC